MYQTMHFLMLLQNTIQRFCILWIHNFQVIFSVFEYRYRKQIRWSTDSWKASNWKNYAFKNIHTFTVERFLLWVNGHNWHKIEIKINEIGLFLVCVVGNCGTENKQAYKKTRANGEIFLDPILKQNQKSHSISLRRKRVNLIDFVVSK